MTTPCLYALHEQSLGRNNIKINSYNKTLGFNVKLTRGRGHNRDRKKQRNSPKLCIPSPYSIVIENSTKMSTCWKLRFVLFTKYISYLTFIQLTRMSLWLWKPVLPVDHRHRILPSQQLSQQTLWHVSYRATPALWVPVHRQVSQYPGALQPSTHLASRALHLPIALSPYKKKKD